MANNATVSNSPTSTNADIPVLMDELSGGANSGQKIQVVRLDVGSGASEQRPDASHGVPVEIVGGSVSASLASSSSSNRSRTLVDSTAGGKQVLAANPSRLGGFIKVDPGGSDTVYVSFSGAADATDVPYAPGDEIKLADGAVKWTGAVFAFCVNGPVYVYAVEYT